MNIIILSGIPGSGKSTFRNDFIKLNPNTLVLSSDDIRDEIINNNFNREELTKNGQVNPFNELYNRLEKALISQRFDYIVIDATNVSRKERNNLVSFIKNINNGTEIDLFVFYNDIFTLYDRVYQRTQQYKKEGIQENIYKHRFVNKDVIDRMLLRFDIADINEGFNNIIIFNQSIDYIIGFTGFNDFNGINFQFIDRISNGLINNLNSIQLYKQENWKSIIDINNFLKNNTITEKQIYQFLDDIRNIYLEIFNLNTINLDEIQIYFKRLLNTFHYFLRYIGFEQTSKYHKETLEQHIFMMFKEFLLNFKNGKYQEYFVNTKNNKELFFISMILLIFFHDIGKLFTRKTKLENLLLKGSKYENNILLTKSGKIKKINNLNDYQFLGHEKVSATIFFFEVVPVIYKYFNHELGMYNEEIIDLINSLYGNIYNHLKYHKIVENSNYNINNFLNKINEDELPYTKGYIDYYLGFYLENLDNNARIIG